MSQPPYIPGGKDWEALGFPVVGLDDSDGRLADALTWESFLPAIISAGAADESDALLLSVIALEAMRDGAQAARWLDQVRNGSAIATWLRYQIALLQVAGRADLHGELLDQDTAVSGIAAIDPSASNAPYLLHLLLALSHDRGATRGSAALPGPSVDIHLARLVAPLVCAAKRDFASMRELSIDRFPETVLLAAHAAGDHGGDLGEQHQLLVQLAASNGLLATEALLELAFGGHPADEGANSLARRAQALEHHGSLRAEAAATRLLWRIALLHQDAPAGQGGSAIDDDGALCAWRHLNHLVERARHLGEHAPLAELYRTEASCVEEPLATVMRIRAAEHLIATGGYQAALELLDATPPPAAYQRTVLCYRTVCASALGYEGVLCEQLVDWLRTAGARTEATGGGVETQEDHVAMLHAAAAIALLSPEHASQVAEVARTTNAAPSSPAQRELYAALLSLGRTSGGAAVLAGLWREVEHCAPEPMWQGVAAFAAGIALLDELEFDEAIGAFSNARDLLGERPAIMAGLALSWTLTGNLALVVETIETLATRLVGAERTQLLQQATLLASQESGDPARALQFALDALRERPSNSRLRADALSLALRACDFDRCCRLLEEGATYTSDPAKVAAYITALGRVLMLKLDDPTGAEDAFRRALSVHPLHPEALDGLKAVLVRQRRVHDLPPLLVSQLQLADSDALRTKLHSDLAVLHNKLWEQNGDIADAHACLHHATAVLAVEPGHRVAIQTLLGVVEAHGWWGELVRLIDPATDSVNALVALRRASRETEDWQKLGAACMRLAELGKSVDERIELCLEAGDVYVNQLDDDERAEHCFRLAFEELGSLRARARLVALYRRLDRLEEVANLLERELAELPGAEQVAVRLELGQLYSERLGNRRAAIQHYGDVLAADPANVDALRALEPLLEKAHTYADLARVLERLLALCDDRADALRILLKLGRLYGKLGDVQSLLQLSSRLAQEFSGETAATEFAEEVYRAHGRFAELNDLYQRRIATLEGRDIVDEVELGSLYERKGNIELSELSAVADAVESLTRAVELVPTNKPLLAQLEHLLAECGDWQRLVAVHERRANRLTSREQQIASLKKAARIAQHKLQDEAETGRIYERIHALDPSDAESFAFLEQKLARKNDSQKLVELLIDRADRVPIAHEELDYLLRAASTCEQIDDGERAKLLYERALKLHPESRWALEALSRIYEALELWEQFLEITERQLKLETKAQEKALFYFKCGSVIETKYHDEEQAISYYTQAIETFAGCLPALHSLRDLHARREQWRLVVKTLEMEAGVWAEKSGRADVLAQTAEVYASKLHDRMTALEYYRKAIETDPENMLAALALFEAYCAQGNHAEATAWGDVYSRRLSEIGSQRKQVDFLVRWADSLQKVQRFEDSARALMRAVQLLPGHPPALFGFLELCRVAPASFDFAGAFADLLRDASKREDTFSYGVLSAALGVLAEHRRDTASATELYARAVETAGPHIRIAAAYANLLSLLGEDGKAWDLVVRARALAHESSFSEWIDASLWLVDHALVWRQDATVAAQICREVLEEQPNQESVRLRLARAALMLGDFEVAVREHKRICDQLSKQGSNELVLAKHLHALGLAAIRAAKPDLAATSFLSACDLAPGWAPSYHSILIQPPNGISAATEERLVTALGALAQSDKDTAHQYAEVLYRRGESDKLDALEPSLTGRAGALAPHQRCMLGQWLVGRGKKEAGISVLRALLAQEPDYVPGYQVLAKVAGQTGQEELGRRAQSVVDLALGAAGRAQEILSCTASLSARVSELLLQPLATHPLDGLWRLLGRGLDRRIGAETPAATVVPRDDVGEAVESLLPAFGGKLELHSADLADGEWQLHGNRVLVARNLTQLAPEDLRMLLALAHSARLLGYDLLHRYKRQDRVALARMLFDVLLVEPYRSREVTEFVLALSRKDQRQVSNIVEQSKVTPAQGEVLTKSWLATVDRVCFECALVATEDLWAGARLLGRWDGIVSALDALGGNLTAVPRVAELASFFVSEAYEEARFALEYPG